MALITVEDVRLSGIPCQAEIETYGAERGAREGGLQLEPDYDAGWDLYRVLDRRGYQADWLEKKLEDWDTKCAFEDSIDDQLALQESFYV